MTSRNFRRILAIVTSLLILTTFVQVGLADEAAEAQLDGAAAPSALVTVGGATIGQVRAKGETAPSTRTDTVFALIPGAEMTIAIAQPSFLLVRYAAESACFGAPSGHCSVRITVNGVQANPASGIDFAFDSPNAGAETNESWEGHAMERFTGCLAPGNYTVRASWASRQVGGQVPTFRLDDWSLVAEQVAGCQGGD